MNHKIVRLVLMRWARNRLYFRVKGLGIHPYRDTREMCRSRASLTNKYRFIQWARGVDEELYWDCITANAYHNKERLAGKWTRLYN
jgi:hypothetical protein